MLTKTQLQQEVQNLETKLQEFREQLNTYKAVTIETAGVGDTLEDGTIVLKKKMEEHSWCHQHPLKLKHLGLKSFLKCSRNLRKKV
jgi:hypothetical protein